MMPCRRAQPSSTASGTTPSRARVFSPPPTVPVAVVAAAKGALWFGYIPCGAGARRGLRLDSRQPSSNRGVHAADRVRGLSRAADGGRVRGPLFGLRPGAEAILCRRVSRHFAAHNTIGGKTVGCLQARLARGRLD